MPGCCRSWALAGPRLRHFRALRALAGRKARRGTGRGSGTRWCWPWLWLSGCWCRGCSFPEHSLRALRSWQRACWCRRSSRPTGRRMVDGAVQHGLRPRCGTGSRTDPAAAARIGRKPAGCSGGVGCSCRVAAVLIGRHGGGRTGPVIRGPPFSRHVPSFPQSTPAWKRGPSHARCGRQATAWAVTAFFGLQAMLYFAVTSWLTVFLASKGLTAGDSAAFLAWFSVAGLPASLLAPVLASRPAVLRIMAPGLGVLVAAALLGVLAGPAELQFLLVGVLGVVQSAPIRAWPWRSWCSDRAGPQTAGRLSAMSQGLGFALASLGPLGAALLHDGPVAGSSLLGLWRAWPCCWRWRGTSR